MSRPTLDQYFIRLAQVIATRATCNRAHVGAVLVFNKQIISSGYNGSKPDEDHCEDVGCLMDGGHCVRTIHSEENAIAQCISHGRSPQGATIYCTHTPCFKCAQKIVANGIIRVVYAKIYRPDGRAEDHFRENGIPVERLIDV